MQIIRRRYSEKKAREVARRVYGREYRKRKGIKTCYCSAWWFPHRRGSELTEDRYYGYAYAQEIDSGTSFAT